MVKKQSAEREARLERLRRQQTRTERRRGLLVLALSAAIVVGLLVVALGPYVRQQLRDDRVRSTPISRIGVSTAAAGCDPVSKKPAEGSGQHVTPPNPISYPDAPPAFGRHWGNFLQGAEIKSFYAPGDRPRLERLVHSLEHGHTILWYDDSVRPGTRPYAEVREISTRLGADAYLMAAPWTASDGAPFPAGKHVALTHWTGPEDQHGVWKYCGRPSGSVVAQFTSAYPSSDAPEPGAP